MKTAKVTSVRYGDLFNSQHGPLHSWWVSFDNGDNASVNTKEQKEPWAVGDEAHYTIKETKQGKRGPWYTIKKEKAPDQQQAYSGGASKNPDVVKSQIYHGFICAAITSGAKDTVSMVAIAQQAWNAHQQLINTKAVDPAVESIRSGPKMDFVPAEDDNSPF